jgi:hypothetical protein
MVEKFASISKKIPWFLLLKAFFFALAAVFLAPAHGSWFLLVAFLLYFFPRFQSVRYAPEFLMLVLLSLLVPQALWIVFLLSLSFFLLLGIKEMVFVRRLSIYRCLAFVILFLVLLVFFFDFTAWSGEQVPSRFVFILALLPAVCYWILLRGVVYELKNQLGSGGTGVSVGTLFASEAADAGHQGSFLPASLVTLLSAFMFWQLTLVALFLPLDFLHQAAVMSLVGAVFIEIIPLSISRSMNSRSVLTLAAVFLALLFVILVFAPWRY